MEKKTENYYFGFRSHSVKSEGGIDGKSMASHDRTAEWRASS